MQQQHGNRIRVMPLGSYREIEVLVRTYKVYNEDIDDTMSRKVFEKEEEVIINPAELVDLAREVRSFNEHQNQLKNDGDYVLRKFIESK